MTDKRQFLESHGWIVGPRDARLNTDYPGQFMVVEPHDESELPTKDGRDGPWCVVGDDLDELIAQGYDCLVSMA